MTDKTCNACAHWDASPVLDLKLGSKATGLCRWGPPAPYMGTEGPVGAAVWPTTARTDWCGSFIEDTPSGAEAKQPLTGASALARAQSRALHGEDCTCYDCLGF